MKGHKIRCPWLREYRISFCMLKGTGKFSPRKLHHRRMFQHAQKYKMWHWQSIAHTDEYQSSVATQDMLNGMWKLTQDMLTVMWEWVYIRSPWSTSVHNWGKWDGTCRSFSSFSSWWEGNPRSSQFSTVSLAKQTQKGLGSSLRTPPWTCREQNKGLSEPLRKETGLWFARSDPNIVQLHDETWRYEL